MATACSRQDISMPFLQIRYVKCTEKIPGLMIAIAGLLTSLWANCILLVVCIQVDHDFERNEMYIQRTVIQTSQLTHFIIVLTCTAGLILGLKEKNRSFLPPWLIIKLLELVTLLVGCVLLVTGGRRQQYIGLMPLAICFFLIGGYISLCVWDTYGKMAERENRSSSLEDVSLTVPDELALPKDPPSYDSFLNHTQT